MQKITDDLSIRLTNLTFISTLLILLRHLSFSGLKLRFFSGEIEFVTHLAVPIFFAMSGFFVASRSHADGWYVTLLKKRFWSLVIPYFAMCTLYILPLIVHHNILHAGNWPGNGLWFDWYTVKRVYGLTYEFHPACGTFWYIRCLVFFVVLSPLFITVIRQSRYHAIGFLAILVAAVAYLQSTRFGIDHGDFFYSFFSVRGIVFFVGGMTLAYWGVALPKKYRLLLSAALLLGGEVLRHCFSAPSPFLSNLRSIVSWLMLSFGIFGLMPSLRLPKFFTAGSFAMFAFHSMVYMAFAIVFKRLSLSPGLPCDLLALGVLAFTACLCCAIAALLRKFCAPLASILFGGR